MNKHFIILHTLVIFLLTLLFFLPCPVTAADKNAGILLADDQGNILYSQNPAKQFVPASTLKILTSLAAIDHFGMDYRFKTWFAYDKNLKNLYIKGFGDPLFISETIQALCRQIVKQTGLKEVNNIILDHSFFDSSIDIPGTGNSKNPYDSTTGALCANFNTISFKWDSIAQTHVSSEPQTPLLDVFLKEIKSSGLKQGRILLSLKQRKIYPGLLVKFFLEQNKIIVKGRVFQGDFDFFQDKVFVFESLFTIKQTIQKLLKYSNNFMANQLMLTMGADTYNFPATLDKGIAVLKEFAAKKLKLTDISIDEGSGLSSNNRISPGQMLKIMMAFMPFHDLLTRQKNEYYKTGTLSDVRCRAGYIRGQNSRLYPFVIMVNEQNKNYDFIRKDLLLRVKQYGRILKKP